MILPKTKIRRGHETYYVGSDTPLCALCKAPASYDANCRRGWAYLCSYCFSGETGLGKGQRLYKRREGDLSQVEGASVASFIALTRKKIVRYHKGKNTTSRCGVSHQKVILSEYFVEVAFESIDRLASLFDEDQLKDSSPDMLLCFLDLLERHILVDSVNNYVNKRVYKWIEEKKIPR